MPSFTTGGRCRIGMLKIILLGRQTSSPKLVRILVVNMPSMTTVR